jgi:hypothetical protein
MPQGSIVLTSHPSLDEHEAHVGYVQDTLAALREKNAMHAQMQRELTSKTDGHSRTTNSHKKGMTDLQDRAKFVQAIMETIKPESKTFSDAHEFYQQMGTKVREKGVRMLSEEMADTAKKEGKLTLPSQMPKQQKKPKPIVRQCPMNFGPFQGLHENAVVALQGNTSVLLGLRSSTHWSGNRRPGRLPSLLPRESPVHLFAEHTASWQSRSGKDTMGRSRAYISELSRSTSSLPRGSLTF